MCGAVEAELGRSVFWIDFVCAQCAPMSERMSATNYHCLCFPSAIALVGGEL